MWAEQMAGGSSSGSWTRTSDERRVTSMRRSTSDGHVPGARARASRTNNGYGHGNVKGQGVRAKGGTGGLEGGGNVRSGLRAADEDGEHRDDPGHQGPAFGQLSRCLQAEGVGGVEDAVALRGGPAGDA